MIIPYKLLKRTSYDQLIQQNQQLEKNINDATGFIKAIELGELDFQSEVFTESANTSSLSSALLSMRSQMKDIAEKERERSWATEGLAKFVEILRANNEKIENLYNNIIASLVKYLEANQGGLFVINDDDDKNPVIELVACYAYNRKKFLEKTLSIGEGLVGQCVLEQDRIYMTEIPSGYVNITSGLGDASPRSLLIIPLKVNDKVYGVVELASFKDFEPYQIEFVEKLGESIASTISNAKVGFKTHRLLKESQMKEEQLRSQEEEMRQNMEELSATQEEMQRVLRDAQGKETYLSELLNASSDSIFTIDRNYHLISFNRAFSSSLEALGMKMEKGFDLMQIFPDHDKPRQRALYDRALAGETYELIDHSEFNGIDSYYAVTYAPLKDENGQIIAAAAYAKDVTEKVKAQQQSDKLLKEAQATAEELRAQEEEMRQNMEELQSIQEELSRKGIEIEEIRKQEKARADEQIDAQKAVMLKAIDKFRNTETMLNEKIAELEKELAEIKSTQKTTA